MLMLPPAGIVLSILNEIITLTSQDYLTSSVITVWKAMKTLSVLLESALFLVIMGPGQLPLQQLSLLLLLISVIITLADLF